MAKAGVRGSIWNCPRHAPGAVVMTNTKHLLNRRILVIDDNRAIHEDFRKIFSSIAKDQSPLADAEAVLFGESTAAGSVPDFEFDSAFQGQEGLSLIRRSLEADRPYAMAFVDVRMP